MDPLQDAFVYLVAAVIAVPLAKRLGLGSVLGYLIAGIVIGPALGVVGSETERVKHFAEFGVVMMLFLVGLELQPAVLWKMRGRLLGLGGTQVIGTTALVFACAWTLGLGWQPALAVGMTLALSSTAIVLQTLNEKGLMRSPPGQSSFSVLLFQDIAVIPMLALMPLLATTSGGGDSHGHHGSVLEGLPGWLQTTVILGVMAGIVGAGRFLVRPVFRFIAASRLREIFTAAALLLVVGVALLMSLIGLSPALGTFLAGVVLSDSEYRHELESDIDPFKGLLLGLFFISVGAGIDFDMLFGAPGTILGLAVALMVGKFAVLLTLARVFKMPGSDGWLFAIGLSQAGEFAFVLFAFAEGGGVLAPQVARLLILVVAITMLLTPLGFILFDKVIAPRAGREPDRAADTIDRRGCAIVAGVGRFGVVVSRMLSANGCSVVVLDHDADLIELLRKLGIETFYGDATRPDLLRTAGIDEAGLFVAALDDREKQNQLVHHVAQHHPQCRIIARALDRHHVYELENAGAHYIEREITQAAVCAGRQALIELGTHPFKAERQARAFRKHDLRAIDALRERWNEGGMDNRYITAARTRIQELSEVMQSDRMAERHDSTERGWTPPPRTDAVR